MGRRLHFIRHPQLFPWMLQRQRTPANADVQVLGLNQIKSHWHNLVVINGNDDPFNGHLGCSVAYEITMFAIQIDSDTHEDYGDYMSYVA